MDLIFSNDNGIWVAEFEATSDFNLHIERDTEGRLDIYQKTAGSKYELVYETGYLYNRLVYDFDFTALVYPKQIKIKTKVRPQVAVVTFAE